MEIKTITGIISGIGKHVREPYANIYDYVELELDNGSYEKLCSLIVGPDCERALRVGNKVTVLHCLTANAQSFAFSHNKGLSYVYGIASADDKRVFDDASHFAGDVQKKDFAISLSMFFIWGLVVLLLGTAVIGKSPWLLSLFGLVVPGGLYVFQTSGLKAQRRMLAGESEIAPALGDLRTNGLAAVRTEAAAA